MCLNLSLSFQSAIQTLIRICRHPPRPDVICRYPDCPNKTQIYLTDPGRCAFDLMSNSPFKYYDELVKRICSYIKKSKVVCSHNVFCTGYKK